MTDISVDALETVRAAYINAKRDLVALEASDTIKHYHASQEAVSALEKNLKEVAKTSGESFDIPELLERFTYSQPYLKSVDLDLALKFIPPEQHSAVFGMASIDIDWKLFEDAIRSGEFPAEARLACKEEPGTPRVSLIKIKPTV